MADPKEHSSSDKDRKKERMRERLARQVIVPKPPADKMVRGARVIRKG